MRDTLGNRDTPAFKTGEFLRIVGQQPHTFKAHLTQHFGCRAIHALIGVKAKFLVGIKGVKPAILQGIGAQLVHKPDATPFLTQIKHNAALPAFGDFRNRTTQLRSAVTAQRPDQIAGKTFRMQTDQDRFVLDRFINHNRQMFLPAIFRAKRNDGDVFRIFKRYARFADLAQGCGRGILIAIDAFRLQHQQILRPRQRFKLIGTDRHGHNSGQQARKLCQPDGGMFGHADGAPVTIGKRIQIKQRIGNFTQTIGVHARLRCRNKGNERVIFARLAKRFGAHTRDHNCWCCIVSGDVAQTFQTMLGKRLRRNHCHTVGFAIVVPLNQNDLATAQICHSAGNRHQIGRRDQIAVILGRHGGALGHRHLVFVITTSRSGGYGAG